jgi:xylulokinase
MYLGLDLGTSGLKALLLDGEQKSVASATAELSVSRPHEGWCEQDPADWIAAAEEAIGTLVDDAGMALRPCILWNDTRSHAEAGALDADPRFRQITGNIVFPGFTAPKLAWVKTHEPEIFARVAKVLLPKDYLRLWLTGETISDMSDSAGTAWLDVADRRWSQELLAATGLGEEHMPSLVEGTEPAGRLRGELAAKWGMTGHVVVAGGAGDNAASACGLGVAKGGEAFVSLGTSGVVFAATDSYRPNPQSAVHTFCHAIPATWHQMGVILLATDGLNWLAGVTGAKPAELTGELGAELRAPSGVTFLPYLSGERTPHNDAAIRGALIGLSHQSDRASLTQAVLEGVAFALRDNLEALRAAGTELSAVMAVGGGSRSQLWLKTIATVLDIPVELPADGDFGAAFGAARLGLIAAENAEPVSVLTRPRIASIIEPDRALASAYGDAYARFRALYPALKGA